MATHASIHNQTDVFDQLADQIRSHSLRWAEQLARAGNRRELEGIVLRLFNDVAVFKEIIDQTESATQQSADLAEAIRQFMMTNLHRGLTLKDLAKFLGYSEKYCSELFQVHMGQPFSQYVKRLRLDEAKRLLAIEPLSLSHIAQRLGFSDQFAFSHFFKRALGYSPKQFRQAVAGHALGRPQESEKALLSCR